MYGLHNEMDVSLTFNGPVKIIIGDNGSGKTTILNALYYILNEDFNKLMDLNFHKIDFKFTNSEEFVINKKDLYTQWSSRDLKHAAIRDFSKYLTEQEVLELLSYTYAYKNDDNGFLKIYNNYSFKVLAEKSKYDSQEVFNRLSFMVNRKRPEELNMNNSKNKNSFFDESGSKNIHKIRGIITDNVKGKVLYLPTYRRVEEAIKNFGGSYDESISKSNLIKFGMEDVEKRFKKIQKELKDSAVKLYTNLNGKMLTQLTSTHRASNKDFIKITNTDALKIVFARVGDSITSETEESILSLIDNGGIKQERYHPLVFVLSNLLDVYDEQKETDESIKSFVEIANKYLVKKEFIYDENNVEISVINKKSKNVVTLENLSSGEKQLLSLFSLLYLEKEEEYIVIFDEPELSLSIEWQEMLLPDMLNSGKCKFLVAATHSPFIFDNELDSKTGIIEIMKEYS